MQLKLGRDNPLLQHCFKLKNIIYRRISLCYYGGKGTKVYEPITLSKHCLPVAR